MRKCLKIMLACVLAVVCVFGVCACGGDGGGTKKPVGPVNPDNPNKPTGDSYTIDFYTTVNIVEQNALQAVCDAYADMQYAEGNDIEVRINNNTDPASYAQTVRNLASNYVTNPTIVQTSVASEYYGTDKIVDLTDALEQPNPYIAGNEAWRDALEEDAYRARIVGANAIIPGISYSADYLTVFYNKKAMKDVMGSDPAVGEDGTVDSAKITWDWMIKALDTAQKSGKNFKNPMGLSVSDASCGEESFNILGRLVNMYLDQYFRDFINEVHSQEGDFSYIASVDKDWQYDATDPTIDQYGKYTYNINRVVDAYFGNADYQPTSARYTEVMKNLHELMSYADKQAAYGDIFSRFNETTIMYEKKGGGSYADFKLFYIEDLSYIRTYRDAFKTSDKSGVTLFPSGETIASELGWFLMPAMTSDLPGVATNVRPVGGPKENYGLLNAGSTKNRQALDFMMYLYSPAGQAAIHSSYKGANNAPIAMRQLVKNVQIPAEIDYTDRIDAKCGCDEAAYLIFGRGTDMRNLYVGNTSEHLGDRIGKEFGAYFRSGSDDWASTGAAVFSLIKGNFDNYAKFRNFIYTDSANVKTATGNLVNSPYNTSN